jgi:hypothetical protein
MGDDIEIEFRGGNPKRWHSGKMNIEGGLSTAARSRRSSVEVRLN